MKTTKMNDKVLIKTEIGSISSTAISASCTLRLSTGNLCATPEIGVCYSKDTTTPTMENECAKLGTVFKDYSFMLSSLTPNTCYYFRVYVKVGDSVFYGDVASVKMNKIINGHEFVDLGLPSGLLWAETNIGAFSDADDGEYFAWGETVAKSDYSWETYKYGSSEDDITKYNKSDGKAVLDKEDDAAYVNWGDGCRMPTEVEIRELYNSDNCTWTRTSKTASDGSTIEGYEVRSKKNGNSIFLPASGYRNGDYLYYHGSYSYYWSSTLFTNHFYFAYSHNFVSGYHCASNCEFYRYGGHSVRPVAEP